MADSRQVLQPRSEWQRSLGSHRLLVSGFGNAGGGLYDLTSGAAVVLDDIPTSGIGLGDNRLWRVLRAPGEQTSVCELLSYDDRGVRSYQRFDAIRDPHDVCWHDGAPHIASSWDSTIWRVDDDGSLRAAWWGGPVPDSWHINSLVVVDGRLHVCAFGRFERYKQWKPDGQRIGEQRSGFLLDTATGEEVLGGLDHPHSARRIDDRWYVCESTMGALSECAPDGQVLRRAGIRRFSRGLAVVGNWVFVGGNSRRDRTGDRAEIVVVDRTTFEEVERIRMPCSEIYDIVTVPRQLARAAAVGFGANPARAVAQHRNARSPRTGRRSGWQDRAAGAGEVQLVTPRVAAKLATAGQPLNRDTAARCKLSGELPTQGQAGDVLALAITVENGSGIPLATVPPYPIRLGARWFPQPGTAEPFRNDPQDGDDAAGRNGQTAGEARRALRNPLAALPELLHPGAVTSAEIVLEVPETPGRYELRVALHQAGKGWFGRRLQGTVTVVPTPLPATAVPVAG